MKYLILIIPFTICSWLQAQNASKRIQPNCDTIKGLQVYADDSYRSIPSDYNGLVYKCKDGKVIELDNCIEGEHTKYNNGGFRYAWYDNGQIKWELINGFRRNWHENGQLAGENTKMADVGKKNYEKSWYENGQLKFHVQRKNHRTYRRRTWYDNGQLKHDLRYKHNGSQTKSNKCWDKEGKLISNDVSRTGCD